MIRPLRMAAGASLATLVTLVGLAPASGAGAAGPRVTVAPAPLPQMTAARQAARWLAGQFTPQGYIPVAPGANQPNLSSTAQSVLALSAATQDLSVARSGLAYLEAHVDQYVTSAGKDGPGQLALLILDAESLGTDPRDFGGSDLVVRLLATEQKTGPDTGLFGTEAQVTAFAAGSYQQGLALSALAAAGIKGTAQVGTAIGWLAGEQCPDGGWTSPDSAANACSGTPAAFAGPDTNSTALAIEGLAAQGAVTPARSAGALAFLGSGQDSDGGWSYYPNTAATAGSTDPDSTALVIQSLIALGISPTDPEFARGSAKTPGELTPVSALLSFQLTSGVDAGSFFFPPAPAPASLLATSQYDRPEGPNGKASPASAGTAW